MNDNFKHSDITNIIIKAYYNVYNKLGFGFLEKVYENSMMIELKKLGLKCYKQVPIKATVFVDERIAEVVGMLNSISGVSTSTKAYCYC